MSTVTAKKQMDSEIETFEFLATWLPFQNEKTKAIIAKHMGADRLQRYQRWHKMAFLESISE